MATDLQQVKPCKSQWRILKYWHTDFVNEHIFYLFPYCNLTLLNPDIGLKHGSQLKHFQIILSVFSSFIVRTVHLKKSSCLSWIVLFSYLLTLLYIFKQVLYNIPFHHVIHTAKSLLCESLWHFLHYVFLNLWASVKPKQWRICGDPWNVINISNKT